MKFFYLLIALRYPLNLSSRFIPKVKVYVNTDCFITCFVIKKYFNEMFRNIPNVYVNLDYFLIITARLTSFQSQLFIYNFTFPSRSSLTAFSNL